MNETQLGAAYPIEYAAQSKSFYPMRSINALYRRRSNTTISPQAFDCLEKDTPFALWQGIVRVLDAVRDSARQEQQRFLRREAVRHRPIQRRYT